MKLDSQRYADMVVVSPRGRLDHDHCEGFRAGLQPFLDEAARSRRGLVLDLSALEYVSSAGLRCFMLASKQTARHGGKIVVAALRPVVAEIFQISRFDMLFEVFPTVREALAAQSGEAAASFDRA